MVSLEYILTFFSSAFLVCGIFLLPSFTCKVTVQYSDARASFHFMLEKIVVDRSCGGPKYCVVGYCYVNFELFSEFCVASFMLFLLVWVQLQWIADVLTRVCFVLWLALNSQEHMHLTISIIASVNWMIPAYDFLYDSLNDSTRPCKTHSVSWIWIWNWNS